MTMSGWACLQRLFYIAIASRKTLEKGVNPTCLPCGDPQKQRLERANSAMSGWKSPPLNPTWPDMESRKNTPPRRHPQGNDRGRGDAYQKANTAKFRPLVPKSGASQADSPRLNTLIQSITKTAPPKFAPEENFGKRVLLSNPCPGL